MDEKSYRDHPALNFSLAKHLLKSPAHFQAALKSEMEPTIDMEIGTMIHRWFLEGVSPDYVQQPELAPDGSPWHGGKNICKTWKLEQEIAGRVILNGKQELRQVRMIANLEANATFRAMLSNAATKEHAIIGEYRGIQIKGKLDLWGRDTQKTPYIGDIKKGIDASPRGFCKKCADLKQRMQAEWYCTLLSMEQGFDDAPLFAWVAIEDSEAAPVEIYRHTEESARIGRMQMDKAIDIFKACSDSGRWPSYNEGITDVKTDKWETAEL